MTVSVFVHASGNAEVYFHNVGVRPVMAWPLAASRYPTHIDMALKAVEVATRKLGEGAFNPDISISTPRDARGEGRRLNSAARPATRRRALGIVETPVDFA